MNTNVRVVDMPADLDARVQAAQWSIDEWGSQFPGDDIGTYLAIYDEAARDSGSLPFVLAAFSDERIVGTATLVSDDELPDAREPGPWVAAVYVEPGHRGRGIGQMLVHEAVRRAHECGYSQVYLYTPDATQWYLRLGWSVVRSADLHGSEVTVMSTTTVQVAD